MPQSGIVPLFGAADAKVFRMTGDVKDGSTTYENGIDVPGVQVLSISPEFTNVELRGDNQVQDIYTRNKKIKGKLGWAKMAIDILKTMFGGTITDTGEGGANQRKTIDFFGTDIPGYWKLHLSIDYTGSENSGEGFGCILYKCKLTNFQIEYSDEKYASISVDFEAIPQLSNSKLMTKYHEKTLTAIPTTADSVAPTVASITPTDGATVQSTGVNVVFTLSEPLREDTVTKENFFLVRTDTGAVIAAPDPVYDSGGPTVTIDPTAALPAATKINCFAVAFQDIAGNKAAAIFVSDFTTA